jgi:hypothetical protein
METTTNCFVRDMDAFGSALGQLTGGILNIDPRSKLPNGTTKFVIDVKAVQDLLNRRGSGPTTRLEKKEKENINTPVQKR